MKTFLAALALTIAMPAAAPAQSSQGNHAAHAQHQGMDHGKEHKACCEHKGSDGKPMKCCEKMGQQAKKMACCEKQDC